MGIKTFIYSLVFLTSVVSAKPIINCKTSVIKYGDVLRECKISSDIDNKDDVVFAFQNKRSEFQSLIYEQWKDVVFEDVASSDAKDEETGESLFLSYNFRLFSPSYYNGKISVGFYHFQCSNISYMNCNMWMTLTSAIH